MNALKQHPPLLSILAAALLLLAGCSDSSEPPAGPAAENLAKGKAFMAANAEKDGVITHESGVQYKIIKEVEDVRYPKLADTVKIHYTASHLDGTVYYDTRKDGHPARVDVKYALLGWRKILPMMGVGSRFMVYLPPHMAYSSRGHEDVVEPNETLIFDIELVEIVW